MYLYRDGTLIGDFLDGWSCFDLSLGGLFDMFIGLLYPRNQM